MYVYAILHYVSIPYEQSMASVEARDTLREAARPGLSSGGLAQRKTNKHGGFKKNNGYVMGFITSVASGEPGS